jgi:hypothetical protein
MRSVRTKRFRESESQLPAEVRKQAVKAFRQWKKTPDHPGLRFKNVVADKPIYSVRVTLGYRALGVLEGETMVWFWIGDHSEYERLIKHL